MSKISLLGEFVIENEFGKKKMNFLRVGLKQGHNVLDFGFLIQSLGFGIGFWGGLGTLLLAIILTHWALLPSIRILSLSFWWSTLSSFVQRSFGKMNAPMASKNTSKVQEPKRASSSLKDQPPRKRRKGENPVRIPPATEPYADTKCPNSSICINSACRATISTDDKFCKRCSCCICHLFDDNKDPSLWLECKSGSGLGNSCGLSCHIECALQCGKVGVVNLGQLMQLDGSYCCASCGNVSEILGLLEGTSTFKELHQIVKEAKDKLETEVGPVNDSAKMARGIVSTLSIASDVQNLCSLAIEKADGWLASKCSTNLNSIANLQKENSDDGGRSCAKRAKSATDIEPESSFKIQDLGKISRLAWGQEQGNHNFLRPDAALEDTLKSIPGDIDLNVSPVPDLNIEFMPPVEPPRDSWNHTKTDEAPVVDSEVEGCPKTTHKTMEMQDSGSNMSNATPSQAGSMAGSLGENFEYCLKTIRWLECNGHIKTEFRKKFLTWFSLRSTEKERRVVHSFIQILIEDPSSLADQLIHTFSKIIGVSI
ncbi:Hypothetical predicted protein [Olea europaea subsp. europaea]|uniref:Oberon PHD finger domain-containing protein n=2 Tax=Olea europaea subsp. europaea TaxID=158383 RepID=A0A8S0S3X5_OLEEU|nr:Hypothetical predicted protein [Olea europaea subsp. europaea]